MTIVTISTLERAAAAIILLEAVAPQAPEIRTP
jgi:hypothetical protein